MAGQLLQVQTVYRCIVMVIAISHSTSHYTRFGAHDIYNFISCENGAFLLVETTVCCRFYCWSEVDIVWTKTITQSAYTSGDHCWNGMGVTVTVQCMMQLGFTVVMCMTFWNFIGTANFLAAEVTVWTRWSCQAISPTAWEQGLVFSIILGFNLPPYSWSSPPYLVSEPDPWKNQKEGLGDRLERKCTPHPECRYASDWFMIACLHAFIEIQTATR